MFLERHITVEFSNILYTNMHWFWGEQSHYNKDMCLFDLLELESPLNRSNSKVFQVLSLVTHRETLTVPARTDWTYKATWFDSINMHYFFSRMRICWHECRHFQLVHKRRNLIINKATKACRPPKPNPSGQSDCSLPVPELIVGKQRAPGGRRDLARWKTAELSRASVNLLILQGVIKEEGPWREKKPSKQRWMSVLTGERTR